jgi:hypothetical protein
MRDERTGGVSDAALLAVIGGTAALAGAVWLWGGLAGLLFGHGWPRVGAGQLATVLARLPGRLAHPAAAWPPGVRGLLPGTAGFYGAFAMLGACGAALAAGASRAGLLTRLGRRPAATRWASRGELRTLWARPDGLALRWPLLYAEQRHAVVALGRPSQQSAGLTGPRAVEWDGPAVVLDQDRSPVVHGQPPPRLGPVFVFDPFELSGAEAQTWSPLRGGDVGRRARGRLAAGGRGRARSARRGGRRLLGHRR